MSGKADDRDKLPKEIQEMLVQIAASEKLGEFKVDVHSGIGQGSNFMSDIVKLRLEGEDTEGLPLVLKVMPPRADEVTKLRRTFYFRNELAMYSEVLPAMRRLHEERVSRDERFLGVADFFGGFYQEDIAAVALRDMTAEGYRLVDRWAGMDLAHCRLVVRELGRIHALSFALKDQRPEEFERLAGLVSVEVFMRSSLADYLRAMARHAERALLRTYPEDSVYVRRLREAVPQLAGGLEHLVSRRAAEPHVVIGQGDCWASNYLFKYADDGVTPVGVCMLDLQHSRCSSPINDLAYFLSVSPACGVKKTGYEQLTAEYYSSLSTHLRRLGSDPDRVFPLAAFKEHEKKFMKLGLSLAIMYIVVFVTPADVRLDVERMFNHPEQLGDNLLHSIYVDRITDVVVHMVDHDFI